MNPAPTGTAERVAAAHVRDVTLPDGSVLALVTVDNGLDHTKPTTLGTGGLAALHAALAGVRERARAGELAAVAITGKPWCFVAGADLTLVGRLEGADAARAVARAGHDAYGHLLDMEVPTFAFINGMALGGGLELALACRYRTVSADVTALGLPETYLGLVPGWGGCTLLPGIVGLEGAIELILTRPAANNRLTRAAEAHRLGLVDEVLHPADFLERSIAWAAEVLAGRVAPARPEPVSPDRWEATVAAARAGLERRFHGARRAPVLALEILAASRDRSRAESFRAEEDALVELMMSPELRAALYAFDLITRRARTPAGLPDAAGRPVRSVGIVGAGLMAGQLALLVARRLRVPVAMREIDEDRARLGREAVGTAVDHLLERGRVSAAEANRLRASITVSTDLADLAGADLVIEAVTEIMAVKQAVFAELEHVVRADTVLATNTSALSVTTMAEGLTHPERVVGLHFFNPVDRMPLVEVVRAGRTDDRSLATAFEVAKALGKTAVGVADRPGFVVNRILLRLLAGIAATVEAGTPVEVADRALRPLGLPMSPFALIQLVGLPVALHVLETLHGEFGARFPLSPGLEGAAQAKVRLVTGEGPDAEVDPAIQRFFGEPGGAGALTEDEVLAAVVAGLREEVALILAEGVVPDPAPIDVAMVLGAGWPLHLGGITPYLGRTADS